MATGKSQQLQMPQNVASVHIGKVPKMFMKKKSLLETVNNTCSFKVYSDIQSKTKYLFLQELHNLLDTFRDR